MRSSQSHDGPHKFPYMIDSIPRNVNYGMNRAQRNFARPRPIGSQYDEEKHELTDGNSAALV
jgi:hypothetical protein